MVLGFEDSKKKYKSYVDTVDDLKHRLEEVGYLVDIDEDIGLGATFVISLKGQKAATLEWNVPHYLTFETFVKQREVSFAIDYVKNLRDWEQFLNDVETSLREYALDVQSG